MTSDEAQLPEAPSNRPVPETMVNVLAAVAVPFTGAACAPSYVIVIDDPSAATKVARPSQIGTASVVRLKLVQLEPVPDMRPRWVAMPTPSKPIVSALAPQRCSTGTTEMV